MEAQISIIIPTYNRLSALKKVLPSYLCQQGVGEVIVVDDASEDSTGAFTKSIQGEYPQLKYCRMEVHRGLPAARNVGVGQAKGRYILFGEDDVYFREDYSRQLLECAWRTKADIIGGRIIYLGDGEKEEEAIKRSDSYRGPMYNKATLSASFYKKIDCDLVVPFIHACSLIRREVFDKQLFDEGFRGNYWREDTDFFLRASKNGFKVSLCPHTVCFHLHRDFGFGGCYNSQILTFEYWSLRNNYRLLKRNYLFLQEKFALDSSINKMMLIQILERLRHMIWFFRERNFAKNE